MAFPGYECRLGILRMAFTGFRPSTRPTEMVLESEQTGFFGDV